MQNGLTEAEFYNMTFPEIKRAVEAYREREKQKLRQRSIFDFLAVDLLALKIGIMLSGKGKAPSYDEVYARFFDDPEKVNEEQEKQRIELAEARFLAFVEAHNARILQKEGGA